MVRARHPGGVATRLTHTLSPVDYAQPSDRYYGSQIDLEAVTVVDLGQGSVTDGAIAPGGLDGGTLIRAGTLPSSSLDTTPPPLPDNIAVTSELSVNADGSTVVSIVVSWTPPVGGWPEDYFGTYIYVTNESDNDPVTPAPLWTRPIVTLAGKDVDAAVITGVPGNTLHWVYLRTTDVVGNYSDPSATYTVTTLRDVDAPDVPQAVAAAGGFKSIGVRWESANPSDLMHNEVRFSPDVAGAPSPTAWQVRRTRGNSVYIGDLVPALYWAQVRAVDFSGNVAPRWACTGLASADVFTCATHAFSNGDKVHFENVTGAPEVTVGSSLFVINATATTFQVSATLGGAVFGFSADMSGFVGSDVVDAVDYLADFEAGWSLLVSATAALVGQADIAFGSVIAGIITSGVIDAGTIQTGILRLNTAAGPDADGIQVVYGSDKRVVGQWDENGLVIRSKTADRRLLDYISIDDAALIVWSGGGQQSAINKDGINATAITFGISPGGHNLLFNSSFELSKFLATSAFSIGAGGSTFAGGAGGWAAVAQTNATLGAAAITMAAL